MEKCIILNNIILSFICIKLMGNQQCNECNEHIQQNQAYGSYQILQQGNKVYAIVEKKVQKDKVLQKKVRRQLEMRKEILHSHIVRLHKYWMEDTDYGFRVVMHYQYIPKSLKNRISQLRNKNQCFSEKEIFAIIYGIENALMELYSHNIKHCCINLDTILCKNNFYKLTDVSSTTYLTSFDMTIKGDKQQFLSQKLLDNYIHKSLAPDYEIADDLFSLGIICLMLATQKSADDFYNWDKDGNPYLNNKVINLCLKQIEKSYSSKLIKKIKQLMFGSQNQSLMKSDKTNLSDTLQQLEEEMERVLGKASRFNSTEGSFSKYSRFRQ